MCICGMKKHDFYIKTWPRIDLILLEYGRAWQGNDANFVALRQRPDKTVWPTAPPCSETPATSSALSRPGPQTFFI